MSAGKAIIFSAPSGSGKTTIVRHLMQRIPNLGFSVSATTRPRRHYEKHAIDYYFFSVEEFRKKIDEQAFAEWEEVYEGRFYGTLKEEVQRLWAQGKHVVFDVDVKGGHKLKSYFGENALSLFVKVPDLKVLEDRLRARNTESEETLRMRLEKVEEEWKSEPLFDRVIINQELEEAILQAETVVTEFISA